jgi:hypothetical protein
MTTDFDIIYNCFLSKITDDMYMELDEDETMALLEELMFNALPWFEFPRVNIHNYDIYSQHFNFTLSDEEINIIATYMVVEWLGQQLASVENARMKYSGSDFKFTSQANHMSKLIVLKKEYEKEGFHLQRVYKRRSVDKNGNIRSTFASIMNSSVREGNVGARPSLQGSAGYNRAGGNGDEWINMDPLATDEGFTTDDNISKEQGWGEMRQLRQKSNCGSGWDSM